MATARTPGPRPAIVRVSALHGGHFSIPEENFVQPCSPGARSTVPSLCFLVEHEEVPPGSSTARKPTRVVFDLGVRRDVARYAEPIRRHVALRQPMDTRPDVVDSLARGGLTPHDIDFVVYSHVHWDHVGDPAPFSRSMFVVGHGSLDVLAARSPELRGSHSFFEADLLDPARTIELPDPSASSNTAPVAEAAPFTKPWQPLAELRLPATLDVFGDGSLLVIDAPGHLPGHVNLLARVEGEGEGEDGATRWVYLAGDACHDRRILRGERRIGEWRDAHGQVCCIHADRPRAEATIDMVRGLEEAGVEAVFAHDVEWEKDEKNQGRFFGAGVEHGLPNTAVSVIHPAFGAHTAQARLRRLFPHLFWPHTTVTMAADEQTTQQQRDTFTRRLGADAFHDGWASILALSPEFFSASVSLSAVPREKGHLSRKDQALVGLAVDSAATHLYAPGVRAHAAAALREGATVAELVEVVELASTLGIHACNIGVPLLVDVLRDEGLFQDEIAKPFDSVQERLKAEFAAKRGYWHAFWEDFLRLDPEFFAAYLEFSSVPWTKDVPGAATGGRGVLEPKMKELVYCAFDCASTHLYVPGLKLHMKNALGYGATPHEIVEVLEIATLLSLHTAHVAAPIIAELAAASGAAA
ncbi:AhpD-like protein [Lasiosphaeria miniovina]|uniref:AhpD-like protein n=1 Tax=Lasiosphaeria miniovina TaxID=1954250 RepID=A0AA40AWP5_9PEZI|nr:AhpD-like protein [Lasiosphaeria miniovina]KAK0723383.1 AhpD-like protein [Lasiosphaeria miniovina]